MKRSSTIQYYLMLLFVIVSCHSDKKNEVDQWLETRLKMNAYLHLRTLTASYSGAVLVAGNDSILFSKGFGLADKEQKLANTKDTKFKIGSITKTFTALAILQLQEKDKLSIEDKLSKFLPDFPKSGSIQIKHLLNHSSGLPQNWRDDWHEKKKFDFDSIIEIISKKTLLFEPGTSEAYSNCGYALLTKIIEITSGLSYEEYCNRNIFKPAGMQNSGAVFYPEKGYKNFATGYEYGAGYDGYNTNVKAEFVYTPNLKGQASAYATVEDLYKYDHALKNGILLNKVSTQLMLNKLPDSEYTLGSWLNVETKTNGTLSYCSGVSNGFESVIYRYLDKNRTIIALNNHQNTDVFNVSRTIGAVLDGKEIYIPEVKHEIPFDVLDYRSIRGTYIHPEDHEDIFEIIIKDLRVFVFSNNDPLEELFLYESNKFFSKNYDLQLDFSEQGKCKWTYNGNSDTYLKLSPKVCFSVLSRELDRTNVEPF